MSLFSALISHSIWSVLLGAGLAVVVLLIGVIAISVLRANRRIGLAAWLATGLTGVLLCLQTVPMIGALRLKSNVNDIAGNILLSSELGGGIQNLTQMS